MELSEFAVKRLHLGRYLEEKQVLYDFAWIKEVKRTPGSLYVFPSSFSNL